MIENFALHPLLLESSSLLCVLDLCQLRLQLDARFSWLVLVPQRAGVLELEDLSIEDLRILTNEILIAGRAVRSMARTWGRPVEKLNVAALGNVVSQLHVHVVGRRRDDAAWPDPVWGFGKPIPLDAAAQEVAARAVRDALLDADT